MLAEYKLLDTHSLKVVVSSKKLVSKGEVFSMSIIKLASKSSAIDKASIQVYLRSDPSKVLYSNKANPLLFDYANTGEPSLKTCMIKLSIEDLPLEDNLVMQVNHYPK